MALTARTVIEELAPGRRAELHAFISEWFPEEACGLVLETAAGEGAVELCPNQADAYHRLDPQMYPRTAANAYILNPMRIVAADKRGDRLVGIWHSHVRVGAYFSDEDIDQALMDGQPRYPGVDWVVFDAQADGVRGFKVFSYAGDGSFQERTD